jgi:L-asparaginase
VRLLAAGGTISMQGERAVPSLDAEQLISAVPPLRAVPKLEAESVLALPGAQIAPAQALALACRAREVVSGGEGVVITTGTDTLEELAVLCALTADAGEAPIVLTGANRPASRPGADGPANLLDAVSVASTGRGRAWGRGCVRGRDPQRHDRAQGRQHRPRGLRLTGGRAARTRGGRTVVAARQATTTRLPAAGLT